MSYRWVLFALLAVSIAQHVHGDQPTIPEVGTIGYVDDDAPIGGDQETVGVVTPGDREATFQLITDVSLMGGYAGIGAADPDDRDLDSYTKDPQRCSARRRSGRLRQQRREERSRRHWQRDRRHRGT